MPTGNTSEERRAPIRIAPRQDAEGNAQEPEVGVSLEESAALLAASSLIPEDPESTGTTPTPAKRPTAPAKGTPPPAPEPEPEPVEPEPEPEPSTEAEPEPQTPEPEPEPEPQEPETPPEGDTVTIARSEYEELQRAGLRQKDYTQKTQAVADDRRELSAQLEASRKDAARYAQLVSELERTLQEATPKEPDWATLKRTLPPQQYADAREEWDAYQKGVEQVRRERTAAEARVAEDRKTQAQEFSRQEFTKLTSLVPEWKDPQKFQHANAQLVTYARSLGFTDEEINSVRDHRMVLLLRDAALGRRARPGAPATPVTRKPAVVRTAPPGTPTAPAARTPAKDRQAAMSRLRKDKSVDAAAAVFATMDLG